MHIESQAEAVRSQVETRLPEKVILCNPHLLQRGKSCILRQFSRKIMTKLKHLIPIRPCCKFRASNTAWDWTCTSWPHVRGCSDFRSMGEWCTHGSLEPSQAMANAYLFIEQTVQYLLITQVACTSQTVIILSEDIPLLKFSFCSIPFEYSNT